MKDRPTDQPTNRPTEQESSQQTGMWVHLEVTLPVTSLVMQAEFVWRCEDNNANNAVSLGIKCK